MNKPHNELNPPAGRSIDLEARIMDAVRSAPRPLTRRAVRTRRFAAMSGGVFALAALGLVATLNWSGDPSPIAAPHQVAVPSPQVVGTLDPLSVWRMPVADVRAVTEAVDGARGEAARTALSLVEQASSGLRILSVTAEGEESKKEVRGGWRSEASWVGLAT